MTKQCGMCDGSCTEAARKAGGRGGEGCNQATCNHLCPLTAGEAHATLQLSARSTLCCWCPGGFGAWGSCLEGQGRREDQKGPSLPVRWVKCRANPVKLQTSIGSEWEGSVRHHNNNHTNTGLNTQGKKGCTRAILLCHFETCQSAIRFCQ